MKLLSRVRLFAIPWTVAYQVPSSMGFSRQEYWSGLPFPSTEDLPDPGIEPRSPALAGVFFTPATRETHQTIALRVKYFHVNVWASLVAQRLKRLPLIQET